MIRLTWLQLRTQLLVTFGVLALIAVVLAVTSVQLAHLYDSSVKSCQAQGDCDSVAAGVLAHYQLLQQLGVVVVLLPGLIGMFWGAPLVARELESGTIRLAWTQSVTRFRWLAVKLAVGGAASMALAGLLSLIFTWWSSPIDRVTMNLFGTFDQRHIVPIGYAAFAFALGVTAGMVIRRIVPAMAATVVAFVAVRLAFAQLIAPNLIAPATRDLALDPASTGFGSSGFLLLDSGQASLQPAPPNIPNSWIVSTQIVDQAGHTLTSHVLSEDCPGIGGNGPGGKGGLLHTHVSSSAQQALRDCVARVGAAYHEVVSFQPASRYWELQWYELAIFIAFAAVLVGVSFWWIRYRVS